MELNIVMLIEKIEKLRSSLYNLIINDRQLTDKSVVDCSQQLDKLLSEYEKHIKRISPSDAA